MYNFCFIDRLEGDIRLSRNVKALVAAGVEEKENRTELVTTRGAVSNKIYLWTNGRVPYIIDSDFGEHEGFIRSWIKACLLRALRGVEGGGGERVLPDMGYTTPKTLAAELGN